MMRIVKHNFWLKVIAAILALSAWAFTRAMDPVEEWHVIYEVDVRLSEGTSLVSRTPSDFTVTAYLTGTASRLERLRSAHPKVILDARNINPGETRAVTPRLDRRHVRVDIEFEPKSFDITVDKTAFSELEPHENTDGLLMPGYYIDSRIGLPPKIMVQGAETLMERLDRVVYNLNLSSLTGSTEMTVDFYPVDSEGRTIKNLILTPSRAEIGISLTPSQAVKVVPVSPDYQGTPASNYALTSSSIEPFLVEVSGPAEALAGVTNVRTSPINLTGKTASFEQSVTLIQPTENVSLSLARATVKVEIQQIDSTYVFENLMVEKRGTMAGYSYQLSTDRVDVGIRGGAERMAQITADLIRPQLELGGYGPGSHDVRVSVALPAGVRNDGITPPTIRVTIVEAPHTDEPDEEGDEDGSSGDDAGLPDENGNS